MRKVSNMISRPKSESCVVVFSCTNIWYWRGQKRPKIGPNSSNGQSEMVFAVSLHFHFETLIIEFRKDWFPPCCQKVQIFSQLALASDKPFSLPRTTYHFCSWLPTACCNKEYRQEKKVFWTMLKFTFLTRLKRPWLGQLIGLHVTETI